MNKFAMLSKVSFVLIIAVVFLLAYSLAMSELFNLIKESLQEAR